MDVKILNNDDAYFAYKALSASQIKTFDKSKREFWKQSPFNPAKAPDKESDALIFGKLAHCILLEPEEVHKRFLVMDWGAKTRGVKYEDAKSKNPDKTIVSPAEYDKAMKMLSNVRGHPLARQIISGAMCEVPFTWKDELTGLPCKCKIDAIKRTKNGIVIIDYKTSSDIQGLLRWAEKLQYPLQDAFYCEGVKAKYGEEPVEFVFIVQSSKEGEEDVIAVVNVDYDSRIAAKDILQARKLEIKSCLDRWEETHDPLIWSDYPERVTMGYSNFYLKI